MKILSRNIVRPSQTWKRTSIGNMAEPFGGRGEAQKWMDIVLCNASSLVRSKERERKIRVGVKYCLWKAVKQRYLDPANFYPLEINVVGREAKLRMVSLRPMNSSFRCCNWWNCNALMTSFFFFFSFRNITREYFARESSGIIVHENLSWKIYGGIFCMENWINDGIFVRLPCDVFFDAIVMTFFFRKITRKYFARGNGIIVHENSSWKKLKKNIVEFFACRIFVRFLETFPRIKILTKFDFVKV